MLGVNQLDFLNYTTAFKGNYRKGPHKLRALLNTPRQGEEFSKNLGGVSVIFGVPLERPDKNSDELLSILTGSKWCDQAVETWLHGFYEFDTLDQLLSDVTLCRELAGDPFMFRAVGASGIAVGKTVARLAGLDPSSYADMTAVASSSTAMTAVAASSTAMTAVAASSTAMTAVAASSTAMAAVAASSTAMAAVAASSTAMTAVAASSTAMTAVAASSTAMAAVAASSTAMAAVIKSPTALSAVVASSTAMTAVAASSTAMTAVAASSTAMTAVAASSTAMAAVIKSPTALSAVVASSTAMAAVAASSTAMAAVASSATAIRAVVASSTAKTALIAQNTRLQGVAATWWNTVQSGFTLVRAQRDNDNATDANITNARYIVFAIPGGYNNGSGSTNCFHGHNGAAAGNASGSYSDTAKRKILLGGGTFTETNDGMVRTWVYSI